MAVSENCREGDTTASLLDVLAACTCDVFDTMIGQALTNRDAEVPSGSAAGAQVVGTVGFTGSSSGLVVFRTSAEAARLMTAALLLVELEAISRDEVVDAVGEITNMVAGSFRTRLASHGDAWAISVPTVTMGSDFFITPLHAGRRAQLRFAMGEHDVVVELVLTGPGGSR